MRFKSDSNSIVFSPDPARSESKELKELSSDLSRWLSCHDIEWQFSKPSQIRARDISISSQERVTVVTSKSTVVRWIVLVNMFIMLRHIVHASTEVGSGISRHLLGLFVRRVW